VAELEADLAALQRDFLRLEALPGPQGQQGPQGRQVRAENVASLDSRVMNRDKLALADRWGHAGTHLIEPKSVEEVLSEQILRRP
jgi:hypothetical protein